MDDRFGEALRSNPVASFRAYSTGAGLANSDKLAAG
jgi:hypothetical protein